MNRFRSVALCVSVLLFAACSEEPQVRQPQNAPTSTLPASGMQAPPLDSTTDTSKLPASHPPIHGEMPKPLEFKAPAGWVSEPPTFAMRREQYRLAKQGSDTSDATVTVIPLGPTDGGPVEQNLQRWAGQWKQPDGSSSRAAMKQSNRKLGPYDVIDLDLSGTYVVDEVAMGGSKQFNEPGWRMLMSWIQAPSGNYYVKLVGPAATVAHWEASFRSFVDSSAP